MTTIEIRFRGFQGNLNNDSGRIELASVDTTRFLNIYMYERGKMLGYLCAHADDARQLRDELLRIYPLDDDEADEQSSEDANIQVKTETTYTVRLNNDDEYLLTREEAENLRDKLDDVLYA